MKRNFTTTLVVIILLKSSVMLAQTAVAPSAGDGSSGSPYEIATWQNLYWISQNTAHWDKHYNQTANIDFAIAEPAITTWDGGAGWTPIGNDTMTFTGTYNGQDHTISGLYIYRFRTRYQGLFGYVATSSAEIKNLGVVDAYLKESGDYTGILTGWNGGNISNSYTTGSIRGGDFVGGLMGRNAGTTSNCYSTASVYGGGENAGGLMGRNNEIGTTNNCYSTGSVIGNGKDGGLVGINLGTMTNCFWDIETSGQTSSAGGTGLSTAQMQMKSTYTSAGWDFHCETANGTDDIWGINDINNDAYPFLMWQGFINLDDAVAGSVSADQVICSNTQPADIVLTGSIGMVQWQWSVQNVSNTFTDIVGAVSTTLSSNQIGTLTQTTYFRALVGVQECQVISESVEVGFYDAFSPGEIQSIGETICYNGDPGEIGSQTAAYGGDADIFYQWQLSTVGETFGFENIGSATGTTYDPPAGIVINTWYRRMAIDGTCNDWEPAEGVWFVTIEQTPIAGGLTRYPDEDVICQGSVVWANLTAGSGGNGNDVIEYRTHDGSDWSVWDDYISGTEINTTGITEVQIRTWREATSCEDSGVVTVTWETELCCANPIIAGSISENQTICSGTAPETIENTASPSGHTGDLEYMWQWSTTSAVAGFNDIANSDAASYSPGNLTNTTWFRRLARVTCVTDDWATAVITDAVKIYIFGEEQIEEPWYSCNTHSSANGTSVYYPCEPGAPYKLTATGHSTPPNDVMHFVYQNILGTNATVIARLADVQNGGWAGVMMREGAANGNCVNNARTILFKTRLYNPSVRIETRTKQGHVMHHTTQVAQLIRWIKIQRNGNNFRVFTSDNGTAWQQRYSINITMNSTIQAGIFTESVQPNRIATAWFDHVEVVNSLKSGDVFAGIVTNELVEGQLRVDIYPNPADDVVTISIPENEGKVNFSITDLDGRVIEQSSFTGSETMLDVSSFRPGMYIIRMEFNGEMFTRRLVVM